MLATTNTASRPIPTEREQRSTPEIDLSRPHTWSTYPFVSEIAREVRLRGGKILGLERMSDNVKIKAVPIGKTVLIALVPRMDQAQSEDRLLVRAVLPSEVLAEEVASECSFIEGQGYWCGGPRTTFGIRNERTIDLGLEKSGSQAV